MGGVTEGFIPRHGGFRKLRSFQAARSGVQNIAEGSLASATSKETELRLTNVARAARNLYLSDRPDKSDRSDKKKAHSCPKCGKSMRQRTARTGTHAGECFWGCTGYPECTGIRSMGE